MFPLDSRRRCARYSTLTLAGTQGGLRLAAIGRAGPAGAAPAGSLPGRRSNGARARKGTSYHPLSKYGFQYVRHASERGQPIGEAIRDLRWEGREFDHICVLKGNHYLVVFVLLLVSSTSARAEAV